MVKTNLLVSCWHSHRRSDIPRIRSGAPFPDMWLSHLQKQVGTLTRHQHNLAQVTFTVPPGSPPIYEEALRALPKKIGTADVEVLHRPSNLGIGFGSFAHAANLYRDQFDLYLCLEDDYVFVQDDFDQWLAEAYERQKADLLIQYWRGTACLTNSVIGVEALRALDWKIPVYDVEGYDSRAQELWIRSFRSRDGFPPPYTAHPFFGDHWIHGRHFYSGIMVFGEGKILITPSQTVDPKTFECHIPDYFPRVIY